MLVIIGSLVNDTQVLLEADLAKTADKALCEKLLQRLKAAMMDHQELVERAAILKENEKFLK